MANQGIWRVPNSTSEEILCPSPAVPCHYDSTEDPQGSPPRTPRCGCTFTTKHRTDYSQYCETSDATWLATVTYDRVASPPVQRPCRVWSGAATGRCTTRASKQADQTTAAGACHIGKENRSELDCSSWSSMLEHASGPRRFSLVRSPVATSFALQGPLSATTWRHTPIIPQWPRPEAAATR